MTTLTVPTNQREEMLDITSRIRDIVKESRIKNGFVICFVPHTTAAVTINESADPDVKRDILYKLNKEIPQNDGFRHAEGNSDSHIKASLIGCSEHILVDNGELVLGTWQGIFFCEFDGPRQRKLSVSVFPSE